MNLIDGQFTLPQIVDLQHFRTLLETFTQATGFTTALISYPEQQVLIATGGCDICTHFHRAVPASARHCVFDQRELLDALVQQHTRHYTPCALGLIGGATPVLVGDVQVACLTTGQIFLTPPDESRFLRQADKYGYDPEAYLTALRAVPVVTEVQLAAALGFLRGIAQLMAAQAMTNVKSRATTEALRVSEARARTILDAADVGLLIVDAETHQIISVNPKAQALFETTEEHLLHRVCHRFICPAEVGKCPITDLKQTVDTSERRLLTASGESRPILKSVKQVQIDGRDCLVESYMDITAQKRFEQRLTAIRDTFLHFGTDPTSNINRLTVLAGELLAAAGATYSRLEGDCLRAVGRWNAPPDAPLVDCAEGHICADVIKQRTQAPCVLRDLPHSRYAVTDPNVLRYGLQTYIGYPVSFRETNIGSLCVVFTQDYAPSDDDLQLLGILAMAIGIEELRLQAMHELAESEERYKAFLHNAVEGIAAADIRTGRVKFYNPAICTLFGYTADEFARLTVSDMHPPEDSAAVLAIFHALARGEKIPATAIPCRRKDGSIFYADITASSIVLEGEAYLVGFFTDITERKQVEAERLEMERRLLHSQKLESLGVLAGGIAHDFNNLLMAIIGNLDTALLNLHGSHPARDGIEQAILASHHATELTRQMLAYSGKGRVILDTLDLNTLVRDNTEIFRMAIARTITLRLAMAPELPPVIADPGQAQQVVMNLLTNASEAIGATPGVITLVTGEQECDAAYLQRSRLEEKPAPGRFVFVEVTDNGCGMDADTLANMFDPFYTTKFTGRGLGLSAVLGILQGHRGALMVDSAVGHGTSMRVLFPACTETAQSAPMATPTDIPSPPAASAPVVAPRILVIDDDETIRFVCTRLLTAMGFTVVGAADGQEAIRLCQAASQHFDCLLLDLTMPRMDGVETFKALKRFYPDLPVILCSGYTAQEVNHRFSEHKPDDFLQKPYRSRELQDTINRVLQRRQGPSGDR